MTPAQRPAGGVAQLWRMHLILCGVLAAIWSVGWAVLLVWVFSAPSHDFGHHLFAVIVLQLGIVYPMAYFGVGTAIVALAGLAKWTAKAPRVAAICIHVATVPLSAVLMVEGPEFWSSVEAGMRRREAEKFADCVVVQACGVSPSGKGEGTYDVSVDVESCRAFELQASAQTAGGAFPVFMWERHVERGRSQLVLRPVRGPLPSERSGVAPLAWEVILQTSKGEQSTWSQRAHPERPGVVVRPIPICVER